MDRRIDHGERPTASRHAGSGPGDGPDLEGIRRRGRQAERRACWHLLLRGWRIVARNWRSGDGELDLVAARWRTLLIVEVRQRPTLDGAWASVDAEKLKRTMATARRLVARHDLHRYHLRLDLIGIDAMGRLARRRDVLSGWLGT